jgi:replication initiation and membrane attachment protein
VGDIMKTSILPADTYMVVNKTILNDVDRKILTMLYQPIIGHCALSLYFSLWSDLDKTEIMSIEYTHHHLMAMMKLNLTEIIMARHKLEAIGLLKTYLKKGNVNNYVYELYSPHSARDFFDHPVLNISLYSNLGKKEYEQAIKYFEVPKINLRDFDDITISFNEVYESVPLEMAEYKEDIRKANKLDLNLENNFDFDLLISSIPSNMINNKTFSKDIKDLITKLSFIYNIDALNMVGLIRNSLNERCLIDKEVLRKTARNYYQFEEVGNLPTLVYKSQPEYLRKELGDSSKRAKMIYTFETITPYDFLRSKYNNGEPTIRDLRLLESLLVELDLKPGVVNVLIDYVLKTNNNKLTKAYIDTIAGQWKRLNIETVEDAMKVAEKEHKKYNNISNDKNNKFSKKNEKLPEWFDKKITENKVSLDEQEEMAKMLKEFE